MDSTKGAKTILSIRNVNMEEIEKKNISTKKMRNEKVLKRVGGRRTIRKRKVLPIREKFK